MKVYTSSEWGVGENDDTQFLRGRQHLIFLHHQRPGGVYGARVN